MQQLVAVCNATEYDSSILLDVFDWETEPEKTCFKDFDSYTWNISNKYYTASVDVCLVHTRSLVSKEFGELAEAAVVFFNSVKTENGFDTLNQWLSVINEWDCETKMAVCEKCSSGGDEKYMNRVIVQKWCIENDFELVELNPDEEDFDEYEDFGTKRIRSALNTHMWPQMLMKSQEPVKTHFVKPTLSGQSGVTAATVPLEQASASRMGGLLLDDNELNGFDGDEEDFAKLFEKLSVMKENASKISENERVAYAENVVKMFWSAIGGDDNEVLSSEDEAP